MAPPPPPRCQCSSCNPERNVALPAARPAVVMASARRLLGLLAAIERGLSAPAASAAEAWRLREAGYDAFDLVQQRATIAGASSATLIGWVY